ncbi:MAG: 3-phosphoshikimate 1-carboxyvinyltransferase [Deltaproteobacteria bacterium]|nr:3-phosphoshikimate 1-carboxyvinyltransferase [Candidatus Anaeroferrophillacea bacterium]
MHITPLTGTIAVPGDKSISHRALIMAALARGKSRITGFLDAADTRRTARIIAALGADVQGLETGGELVVTGRGIHDLREPADILYTGNSGTTTRLLAGLLAGQPFFSVLSGDESLNDRPMKRVIDPLARMGATIMARADNTRPPLAIRGGNLAGIHHQSPVASAQIKSCLLLAGLFAAGETAVTEPRLSRDHTERMFHYLGLPLRAEVRPDGTALAAVTAPGQDYPGTDFAVPGDPSAAAFFLTAAAIIPGSEVRVTGVGLNPTRTGILDVLTAMGAEIAIDNRRDLNGEPAGDITVTHRPGLRGTEIGGTLIPRLIDELPVLALVAAHAEGSTVIRDAAELRIKESDRLAAIADLLTAVGTEVEPREDGIVIHGGTKTESTGRDKPLAFRSRHDHRMAMTAHLAGLAAGSDFTIDDTACVETSFPGFFPLLEKLMKNEP